MLNGNGEQLYKGKQELLENVGVRVCSLERYHLSKDTEEVAVSHGLPGEKQLQWRKWRCRDPKTVNANMKKNKEAHDAGTKCKKGRAEEIRTQKQSGATLYGSGFVQNDSH